LVHGQQARNYALGHSINGLALRDLVALQDAGTFDIICVTASNW
jgi:hypothetical protein